MRRDDAMIGGIEACEPAFQRFCLGGGFVDDAANATPGDEALVEIDLRSKKVQSPRKAARTMIEIVTIAVYDPEVRRRRDHAQFLEFAAADAAIGAHESFLEIVIARGYHNEVGFAIERGDKRALSHHPLACHKERIDGQKYAFFRRHDRALSACGGRRGYDGRKSKIKPAFNTRELLFQ